MKLLFVHSATCRESSYIMQTLNCITPAEMIVDRIFINDYVTTPSAKADGFKGL